MNGCSDLKSYKCKSRRFWITQRPSIAIQSCGIRRRGNRRRRRILLFYPNCISSTSMMINLLPNGKPDSFLRKFSAHYCCVSTRSSQCGSADLSLVNRDISSGLRCQRPPKPRFVTESHSSKHNERGNTVADPVLLADESSRPERDGRWTCVFGIFLAFVLWCVCIISRNSTRYLSFDHHNFCRCLPMAPNDCLNSFTKF